MDIFTLDKTTFANGKTINGIKSLLWVERYNDAGEFTITGPATRQFLLDLAEGVIISHSNTEAIMMVETHTIDSNKEGLATVEIKGRSIEQIVMENRLIVTNMAEDDFFDFYFWAKDTSQYAPIFDVSLGNTHDQVEALLNYYLDNTDLPYHSIPNFNVRSDISGTEPIQQERTYKTMTPLSDSVRDMLSSINAGLKIERPNTTHPNTLEFVIHGGINRSVNVRFDWNFGDLESARYVWSSKNYKNAAYVNSLYYTFKMLPPATSGLDLRIMAVDATDWKLFYPTPDAGVIQRIRKILAARGNDQLSQNKRAQIVDATISKTARFKYNVDYKMGDLVHVVGDYDTNVVMQVVEYATTLDETGSFGFPTLMPYVDNSIEIIET